MHNGKKEAGFRAGEMDPYRDFRNLSFCDAGTAPGGCCNPGAEQGMAELCAGGDR